MSTLRLPDELCTEYGWELVETGVERALTLPFFSIRAHNAIYEDTASAAAFEEIAAPAVEVGGRSFFATNLEFRPSLSTFGVDPASVFGVARSHAKREFEESLAEDGLTDLSLVESREFDRPGTETATVFGYEAAFPLSSEVVENPAEFEHLTHVENPAQAADEQVDELALESELWMALWPTDGAYAMAGGMYPVEEVDEAVQRQAPAATLATEVRVDPNEERDRERVFEAMRQVS
ncbi:hypothetical protein [Haloarchaeobius sp. TZWWS8]|uniref:hypothetical protein n=1 Tax=Haloarchaeobius sp. TZWWS8 TaxID=3446121 RepID=UPI003EBD31E3